MTEVERGINDHLNRTVPDLSLCFQQTVLVSIPIAYMLIGFIPYMYALNKRVKFYIVRTWLNVLKTCCGVLGACGAIAEIALRLSDYVQNRPVWANQFLAPGFIFIAITISVLVVEFERRKSVRTSMFLAGFWILLTATSIIRFRSAIVRKLHKILPADFAVLCLSCILSILNMILTFIVDTKPVFYSAKENQGNPCPSSSASVPSRLFFCWPAKTIWRGFKQPLELSNMWDLQATYTCQHGHNKLNKHWNIELNDSTKHSSSKVNLEPDQETSPTVQLKSNIPTNTPTTAQPSLFKAIMKAFWPRYVCGVILELFHTVLLIAKPQILRKLIQFSEDPNLPVYNGILYAFLLLVLSILKTLLFQHMIILQDKQGQNISTAMMAMVYTKSLRLTPAARSASTTGQIVNLMSSDCNGYFELMTYFRIMFSFPIHMILTIALLWDLLGPSALVGLTIILLIIPLNILIATLRKKVEVKRKIIKDSRMKATHDALNGIKVIKLHAWESSFEKKINTLRNDEVKMLNYATYLMSLSDFIHLLLPFLVSLCTFAVYVMSSESHVLTAEIAFVSLAYFQILQGPLMMMSRVVKNLVHTTVAHKRIFSYLLREELDQESLLHTGLNEYDVVVRHGSFSWSKSEQPILKNIELLVPNGSITAVLGTIGSGKSSLISALLGEMVINSGTVNVKGSVGYVAQRPWIQQGSIKDNILFDKECDPLVYDAVLRECALLPDLEVLPAGDLTQIGEKGINLSGGQKLRVSLARAVYQDQDVYLLDDPFSALDSTVGHSIFDRVLGNQGMLKNKTRVLVTQTLWMLSQVDQIVVLQDGQVIEAGTFESLMSNRYVFHQLYTTYNASHAEESYPIGAPTRSVSTSAEQPVTSNSEITDNLHLRRASSKQRAREDMSVTTYTSLPDALDTAATSRPGRPSSMMFVRALTIDDTTENNTEHISSQSWRNTKQKLRRHISVIENKLTEMYKEDNQFSSHYFVSEADLKREDETLLPDDPAPEHIDLEEAEDQHLLNQDKEEEQNQAETLDKGEEEKHKKGFLITEEQLSKGRVKMSVYTTYLRVLGLVPCVVVLVLCLLSRGLDIASSLWLVKWSDHMSEQQETTETESLYIDTNFSALEENYSSILDASPTESLLVEDKRAYYICGFAIFGISQILVSTLWVCVGTLVGLWASKKHHSSLIHSVLAAPMSFHDTTPSGRILNRFGGDMVAMDVRLPAEFRNLMKCMVAAIGCMVVVIIITPWSILAWIILGAIYSFAQVVFVPNLRQVRRLTSANHSPIFSHFTETLHGVTTVRAFNRQERFTDKFYGLANVLLKVLYAGYHFNRFFSVVIEGIGAAGVFMAALLAVLARDRLSAGLLALSVTYVGQITQFLNWMVRLTSACESDIVSVERIKEYIDIAPEGEGIGPPKNVEEEWPRRGTIELRDYSTTYRSGLDLVLRGISCQIYPGEKIGVVGRTGAGKTSLTLAIFRIIEAVHGSILIDNIDISQISLNQLRKNLTIIPQDPVLFSGSLRFNLDPFDKYKDEDLWNALKLAHMADTVNALAGSLSFQCSEGGSNLSVGQRQLICLARALLRKNRILILDEATASCDVETDELIQKTIRREFASCTVITVAHRINTVRDYDRIMVLDNGKLLEMNSPQKLMEDPTTIFHTMARNAGLITSAFHRH